MMSLAFPTLLRVPSSSKATINKLILDKTQEGNDLRTLGSDGTQGTISSFFLSSHLKQNIYTQARYIILNSMYVFVHMYVSIK